MKFVLLALAIFFGVPVMTAGAVMSAQVRRWLVVAMIFSTSLLALNKGVRVTLMSMEWYRGLDRGFPVTVCDLIAVALGIAVAVRLPKQVRWLPFASVPLFLLFGIAIASSWTAGQPIYALFALYKFAKAYLIYWCAANFVRMSADRDLLHRAYLLLAWFLIVYSVYQRLRQPGMVLLGPFDHQNQFCLILNQLIPLLLMWGLASQTWRRSLLSTGTALLLAGLVVLTESRAGIGIMASLLLVSLMTANLLMPRNRIRLITSLVILILGMGALKAAPAVLERIRTAPPESLETRVEFNNAARMLAGEYLLGVGPNNYSAYLTHTSKDYGLDPALVLNGDEDQVGVCHNAYWLMAAELGYPGLVLFVGIILQFLGLLVLAAWRNPPPDRLIFLGLLLGSVALHLQDFLEPSFYTAPVLCLFAVNCGVGVALATAPRAVTVHEVPPDNSRPEPAAAASYRPGVTV